MPDTLPNSNPLSYLGVNAENPPNLITETRGPTTSDTRGPDGTFKVGTLWVDKTTGIMYGLGIVAGGVATWALLGQGSSDLDTLTGDTGGSLTPTSGTINIVGGDGLTVDGSGSTLTVNRDAEGGYPITQFVVGDSGAAGFATVQEGLDAANTAGGGVVYIQPGSYTEDLTLYDAVDLYATTAVSQNQGASVTIIGIHVPPTSGHVGFNSICFVTSTDAFSSVSAGTTHLAFVNCESAVESGYFLDLPNWTGTLEIFDHNPDTEGAPTSIDDGGINNTGGSEILIFSSGVGLNGSSTMNISGPIVIESSEIGAPVDFATGSQLEIQWVTFDDTVTLSGSSTGFIYFSSFLPGSNQAITMSSSAGIDVVQSIIDSSNNPAIGGAGAGALTLEEVVLLDNAVVDGTVTSAFGGGNILGPTSVNGTLSLPLPATQLQVEGGADTDFIGLTILAVGTVTISNTNISDDDRIFIQRVASSGTPGTLTYTITAGVSFTINSSSGSDASILTYFIVRQL